MRGRFAASAAIVLITAPAAAQIPALSRNADLLVPGRASAQAKPYTKPANAAQQQPAKVSLPVYFRGEKIAEAGISPDMTVDVGTLRAWAEQNLSAGALRKFDLTVSPDGTVALARMQDAGLALKLDDETATLVFAPEADNMRAQDIAVNSFMPDAANAVPPAKVSGYANLRAGQDYLHDGAAMAGRQPLRVDLDSAVNVKQWVLENRSDYLEHDATPFFRGNTRLVHDLPDKMVRVAAGDLSYPVRGFQSFQPMAGFSIARNFDLQPYRVTEPAGQESFTLRTPSTVDITVNGRKLRTLRLAPGVYNVSDFPVAQGGNDVQLVITDATGNVETRALSLFSDQNLLKKGLHEYAYNAGVTTEQQDRRIRYDGKPALSMFHRYGVSDTVMAGMAAQGSADVQQLGADVVAASRFGTLGLDMFASHAGSPGFAGEINYRLASTETRRDFSARLRYTGADFATLADDNADNLYAYEAAARYNMFLPHDISAGIGGQFRGGRDAQRDDWSAALTLGKTLSAAWTLNLSTEARSHEGVGAFISATWAPVQKRYSFSASADTLAGTRNATWNYRSDHALHAVQASAGVAQDDRGQQSATGSVNYTGYRGEASFRHDIVAWEGGGETGRRSALLFGTALAYADGHVAVTRPISDSFIMLAPHKTLAGRSIGVNAEHAAGDNDGYFQAKIDHFGPAVLPDATAYMLRPVKIDTRRLPAGYDIGTDNFTALPAYKNGTLLTVGNAANIYADGYMKDSAGVPVALQGGKVKCGDAEQEFFTNAQGRFRIPRLVPGACAVRLYNQTMGGAHFTIPADTPAGRFDAGIVTVEGNAQ